MNLTVCFAFLTSLGLAGCSLLSAKNKAALCPNGQILRIGVDQQLFSSQQAANQQEQEIKKLESFLQKSTHCLIQIESIVNANLGRESLEKGTLDFIFLAPSLSVIALAEDSQYVPLRSLGQDITARSGLLVRDNDDIKSYAGINNKRIGLLPNDLNGYYLPRYNLHGTNISYVYQGLSYDDLVEKLKNKAVDAIAWNTEITPLPKDTRVGAIDPHLLPAGALLMHARLNSLNYTELLKDLDDYSFQLPAFLRYGVGTRPQVSSYREFIKIVHTVEKWDKEASPTAEHPKENQ